MNIHKKVAIVTGAKSGIGYATAILLSTLGYKVFGTSRHGSSSYQGTNFEMLTLDVTNDQSVKSLINEVIEKEGHIDLLVNNAGFGILGGAEESSIEQSRAIFETNFFGCVRMIKAVLPYMHKQGSGRIINISSVLGIVPAPFSALYSATKHAIEGYSESLDHEVRKFNIRSILIEPAFTKTNFDKNSIMVDDKRPHYELIRSKVVEFSKNATETQADSPDVVAQVIAKAAEDKRPKIRYTAGPAAAKLVFMRRFIPEKGFDYLLRKNFQLDNEETCLR